MNVLKKLYCRAYQGCLHAAIPLLPYREPEIVHENAELAGIFKEKGIASALLVTDGGIARLGLHEPLVGALGEAGISCHVYDATVANPTLGNVEEAAEMFRENSCGAVIGFGGGSSDDDAGAARSFIAWIDDMNEKMGIPRTIEGIDPADIPAMARNADAESNPLYPVPRLMDARELERLYYTVGGLEDAPAREAPVVELAGADEPLRRTA